VRLPSGDKKTIEETRSTQDDLVGAVAAGNFSTGVLIASHQTAGRGRFDRKWESGPNDSLTMSLVMDGYADHPRPWLVGMAVSLAAASALHTQIQWPNDLVIRKKKCGGVLTEISVAPDGRRIPVVGIGVNLNQSAMPEGLEGRATSIGIERDHECDPAQVAELILSAIEEMPEPDSWDALRPIWMLFDDTQGKQFHLVSGEPAVALGIGPDGELICSVDGETTSVMAAEAIFGDS